MVIMKKKVKQSLVLIGISRKGEKSFKTILKTDSKDEFPVVAHSDRLSLSDKNQPCGVDAIER